MTTKKPTARSTTSRKAPVKKVAAPTKEPQARAEFLLQVGQGFQQAMKILDGGRISIAALSLGIQRVHEAKQMRGLFP